ncbi:MULTISPECIES: HD-GYP domain-containing protein [Bacillota]|uniref:HD-GYP domain-containing protein n=2 Tax=Amedibacillus TaxID=2749846 RepID=A0A7G9GJ72_9FIRM|nr:MULTISPECIES: hypothetical protein [Bacillota]QNM10854.1 hypothetical protein H9Q80_11230 [[Eubacterium] hominis]MCH4285286.1 hypothetical protein [Amedibacillus hominis]RGB58349.1 hypothetical protein DW271_01260 [Absiella sp. AM22-9]RGB63236.1 hypothetical protein DW120_00300 [Absiella sp. AM10-20]RGB65106.1 hypothetical protein DW113_13145 [Absiella sp. AM09-45]
MEEIKHGFTTREAWFDAFQVYFTKIIEIDDKTHTLMNTSLSCDEWIEDFKRQSNEIRALYLKNDQFKQQHIHYFVNQPENWTEEVADSLLAYIYRYWSRMEDVEAIYAIAQSLQTYYETKNDEIAIMKCKAVLLYCYTYLDEAHFHDICISLCKELRALYIKHYDELSEEDKSMGLSIYDILNYVRYTNLVIGDDFKDVFDQVLYPDYLESIEMMERFMKEADMNQPLNQIVPYMILNVKRRFAEISFRLHKQTLRKDQMEIVKNIAEELVYLQEDIDINGQVENLICFYMAHRFETNYTSEELVEIFMDGIRNLNASHQVEEQLDIKQLMETMEAFSLALQTLGEEDPESVKSTMQCWNDYLEYLLKQPYSKGMAQQINQTIYHYIVPLMKYMDDVDDIFKSLLNITVFRQLQTAIHSLMVGRSANLIMQCIIDKQPHILVDAKLFSTIKEVKTNKEELLSFVSKASLVHDVGKLLCTQVINMQYRRLIDIEYETIKFHPNSSSTILSDIPSLSIYHDIAIGHHKSFDGTFGYPKEFDNTASPQRILIDLIRICDSLDAATDTFGRLYAAPKSFQTVLKEFQMLKGTSYSDVLVDFISEHEDVQHQLENLLEEEREQVYVEMYHIIKGL